MDNPVQTHMLVVSAIAFNSADAKALAARQGITGPCIFAHDTFVFIARPKSEFASGSLKRVDGKGFYTLKGTVS